MRKSHDKESLKKRYAIELRTGCWLYLGYLNEDGYGVTFFHGKSEKAHRMFYRVFVGGIPSGLQLDHLCRNRRCVNPEHLEIVDNLENMRRGKIWESNKVKTHCSKGHPYSGDNLRVHKGKRYCKACQLQNMRNHRAKEA